MSLLGLLFIVLAYAETPKDIQYINATSKVIQNYYKETDAQSKKYLIESYQRLVEYQVASVLYAEKLTSIVSLDDPSFKMFISNRVAKLVEKSLAGETASVRLDNLQKILRILSTENTAHSFITSYLELPKSGSLIKSYEPKRVPYFKDQVRLESNDSRLKISINPNSIVTDFGGAGSGNGILDNGEWIQYSVDVENVSERPFFSSSLYLDETGQCSWTFPQSEIELPELLKGDKKDFSVWVYLSNSCYNQERTTVSFRVIDSQQTDRSGIKLSTSLVVTNRGQHQMKSLSWDTDEPGSSEKSSSRTISSEQRIELSHGLSTNSTAVMGQQNWSADKSSVNFLQMKFNADADMYPTSSGIYPGDDLDIVVVSPDKYLNAVKLLVQGNTWKESKDAQAIFMTDTEVLYDHPFEKYVEQVVVPKEICSNYLDDDNDGKHDCQDSDCKDADVCQEGPGPVPVKDVISLFGKHADLVASTADKTHKNSLAAVQPNFELTLDVKNFIQQYECLVQEIPLTQCGVPVCPSCDTVVVPPPPKEEPSNPEYVAYQVRHYVVKDYSLPTEECNDGWDNDLDGQIDCKDTDCEGSQYCTEIIVDEVCDNGIDDDKDGRRDCYDSDCTDHPACEIPDEVCDNGKDDDRDGRRDCSDSDCANHPACEIPDEVCDNGKDDDKDGSIDCEDSDCPACPERVEKHRIAFGVETSPISTRDEDYIVWMDIDNQQTMLPRQIKYSYMLGNRVPFELFGNSTGQKNDVLQSSFFNLWTVGAGVGYSHPVNDSLRLAAVLRGGLRQIYIQSPDFANNVDTVVTLLPTVSAQWNITPAFDLYMEFGGQQQAAEIRYSFGSVVVNDGFRFGTGFGLSF